MEKISEAAIDSSLDQTTSKQGASEETPPCKAELKKITVPNPEVQAKRQRRRFSAAYKLRILEELDRCKTGSERGSIIRREGLYSSCISDWKKSRKQGALSALNRVVGRKPQYSAKDKEMTEMVAKIAALEKQLSQAQAIIDIQKKVSSIFGSIIPSNQNSEVNS